MKFNLASELEDGETISDDPEKIKLLKCKSDKGVDLKEILVDVLLKI